MATPQHDPVKLIIQHILVDPNNDVDLVNSRDKYPTLVFMAPNARNLKIPDVLEVDDVNGGDISYDFNFPADLPINWWYSTGFTPSDNGYRYTCTYVRVRVNLSPDGIINVASATLDESSYTSLANSETLTVAEKRRVTLPVNAVAEQFSFKISGSGKVNIASLTAWVSEREKDTPR